MSCATPGSSSVRGVGVFDCGIGLVKLQTCTRLQYDLCEVFGPHFVSNCWPYCSSKYGIRILNVLGLKVDFVGPATTLLQACHWVPGGGKQLETQRLSEVENCPSAVTAGAGLNHLLYQPFSRLNAGHAMVPQVSNRTRH